jgi:hypothetical protein
VRLRIERCGRRACELPALPTPHLVELRQLFMAGPDDEQVEAPPRVTYGDPFPLPVPPVHAAKKIAFERPRPAGLTVHGKPLDA